MSLIAIILSNWSLFMWGAGIFVLLAAFGIAWIYLGRRVAELIIALIMLVIIYYISRKNALDSYQKISKDIEDKREQAYEKIDARNTSASDAADRLRNGSF